MNNELSFFAARLREIIHGGVALARSREVGRAAVRPGHEEFNLLALELFSLQFQHNPAYRKICEARKLTPQAVGHWSDVPAVPTPAFKELELTSLAPEERAAVFHSSGTTEQKPGRHYHCAESLAVYEASLWAWFAQCFQFPISNFHAGSTSGNSATLAIQPHWQLAILTPPPAQAPDSSLVHMFETVRRKLGVLPAAFAGKRAADGSWTLDFAAAVAMLGNNPQSETHRPKLILGTAFSFVHLLDFLAERDLRLELPAGSRVLETGGYKNRSRTMPKVELHALITERLGVSTANILCEYGMSELSSQAYDRKIQNSKFRVQCSAPAFHFPPWARGQIISPETGREVADGETGIVRIFDLANVFSVAAIQTEDLGIRRGDGFELIGRAPLAGPRGCSLMTA